MTRGLLILKGQEEDLVLTLSRYFILVFTRTITTKAEGATTMTDVTNILMFQTCQGKKTLPHIPALPHQGTISAQVF